MNKVFQILILILFFQMCLNCSAKKNIKKEETTKEEQEEKEYLEKMAKLEKAEQEFSSKMAEQMKQVYAQMPYFPAEIKQAKNFYAVEINSNAGDFYAKEFGRHGLYGNGYCWEGILEQLIAKEQKSLLTNIEFDSEADTCFISCKNEKSMKQLAEFIKVHLSDKEKFNIVIKKIDKSKLDC